MTTVTNAKDGFRFTQPDDDTILRAALRSGYGMAYECSAGGCGACAFDPVAGDFETLWADAPGLSPRDRRKGRMLGCQTRAHGDVEIRCSSAAEYVPPIRPQRQRLRLLETRDLTHDMREFRFAGEGPAEFLPGQYMLLDLPGVQGSRAYSFSNVANDMGEWHFIIRRVPGGAATQVLFDELRDGDVIGADGPYGTAYLQSGSPRDIVCVAGGSGFAPMLSVLRGASAQGMLDTRKACFLFGARNVRDICGIDELAALPGFAGAGQFLPVVSEVVGGESWDGPTGFVHTHLAASLPRPLADYEFYFAGPPPMSQAIQELLMIEHKVPFGQIHFDRFF
ncbi:FAD-binding oxidoreductase [Novosphingobium naphthalenivorans]|uniref:FAD-binding oxidoreductase n=1 Tax=Novosphingobium naphthalenivorans TaxID=273168 RepID=UPI00082A0A1F|nr:FAD-binding oxidoreductase [Novosphingobium naphthalenivorans]